MAAGNGQSGAYDLPAILSNALHCASIARCVSVQQAQGAFVQPEDWKPYQPPSICTLTYTHSTLSLTPPHAHSAFFNPHPAISFKSVSHHLICLPQVSLQGHGRAVSCIDIEHSGGRLISGSLDYTLRMFDFNGMKADLRSFRWGLLRSVAGLSG